MLAAPPARANPGATAIEIEPRAESLIDARAVRRLVQLELSDVLVPPPHGEREAALFVRVLLGTGGELKVELWERGVAYGARGVAGETSSAQLLARRIALAAGELARELSERRQDEAEAREQARQRALAVARDARARTLDGPRALRVGAVGSFARELALVGPSLTAELHAYRATRLDVSAAFGFGSVHQHSPAESFALGFGPARRFALGSRFALDLGLQAEALLLSFPSALSLDRIPSQHQSWTARVDARVRLESALSRSLRLAVGVGGGMLLRRVPVEIVCDEDTRVDGPFASGEMALILTPF